MRVSWKVLEFNGRKVEAQCFEPDEPTHDLILFCPGFPGAGATLFEQRHAAALVESGYALVVIRHAGTRLDTFYAPSMVNNGWRLMQARKRGDTCLGGGPSTVEGWLLEPLTALHALSGKYENIFIIGNSFGALSSLWSMTRDNAPLVKVRHLILLAGAQGIHDEAGQGIMRIWKPEYLRVPYITGKVALNDPNETVATLDRTYRELPPIARKLFNPIKLTYVVVEKDELMRVSDTEHFKEAIGGHGEIVIDTIDQPHPEQNLMAHDMPDYPTENLLAILAD